MALATNVQNHLFVHHRNWDLYILNKPEWLQWKLLYFFSFCGNIAGLIEWPWNQRMKYWAIRLSARLFTRITHSWAYSALLASLARSVALIRSHAHSLSPEVMGKRYLIWIDCVDLMQFQPTMGRVRVCMCAYECLRSTLYPSFWVGNKRFCELKNKRVTDGPTDGQSLL